MTERAKIATAHRDEKHLPAPEVPRPKGKKEYKPEKIFYVQHRYTEAAIRREEEQHKAWEKEYGDIFEKLHGFRASIWSRRNREWMKMGKYADRETAETAMNNDKRKLAASIFKDEYEYRIVTKEELKKEKNENCRQR